FEGMPIEGANNSTYCSSALGGHSLIATDPSTNCSSAFALFVEYDEDIENCVVNVKNSFEDTVIQVYPNPHRDQFTIELETPQKVKLQVVNLLGQVLYDQQISGQRLHTVSSADWVAGVYYLNTEVDGKMKVVKLIKVD
ncbi:MAG: T9SS type A sorting domain-containing protein, partial [Bacteroidota bacterium]